MNLTDRITEVLRYELMNGCISTHDPRWPRRVAERVIAELNLAEETAPDFGEGA